MFLFKKFKKLFNCILVIFTIIVFIHIVFLIVHVPDYIKEGREVEKYYPIEQCFYSEENDNNVHVSTSWLRYIVRAPEVNYHITLPSKAEGDLFVEIFEDLNKQGSFKFLDHEEFIRLGKSGEKNIYVANNTTREEIMFLRLNPEYVEIGIDEMILKHKYDNHDLYSYKDPENISTWKKLPRVDCDFLESKAGIPKYKNPEEQLKQEGFRN